jgi:hypothetical protein
VVENSESNDTHHKSKEKKRHRYTSSSWKEVKESFAWLVARKADFWSALASILLAILTGFFIYYARKQWKTIDDQLYEMGDTEKNDRMTQRSYIDFLQQVEIRTTVENGRVTSWTPEITIVNDGNTGTYNTLEILNVHASDKELPEDFSYSETGKQQRSDLGPHETELLDAQPIPIAAIQSIQTGGHVYVYGMAEYRDVYQFYAGPQASPGFEMRHLREFCYELRLDSATGDVTSAKYTPPRSMLPVGPHNCTDGDCKNYYDIIAGYN